jgi:hypothetical protein
VEVLHLTCLSSCSSGTCVVGAVVHTTQLLMDFEGVSSLSNYVFFLHQFSGDVNMSCSAMLGAACMKKHSRDLHSFLILFFTQAVDFLDTLKHLWVYRAELCV